MPLVFIQRRATRWRASFWLALLLTPLPTGAQTDAPMRTQDVSVLAGTCVNCHGPDGRSTGGIPGLQGRAADDLLQWMRAYRAGPVPGATVMPRLMKGYDDAQLQALARWFAGTAKEQP